VIVGYVEDGPNLVTMAMNGWGDASMQTAVVVLEPRRQSPTTATLGRTAEKAGPWRRRALGAVTAVN
jgi:hypothetical protein